jgi:hypothetical protein
MTSSPLDLRPRHALRERTDRVDRDCPEHPTPEPKAPHPTAKSRSNRQLRRSASARAS